MKAKEKSVKKSGKATVPGGMSETGNELGVIRIHENVLAAIVRKATCSVDSVIRLAGSSIVDNIAEFVGSKRMHDRSIGIALDGATVAIDVKINVAFGAHIPSVASEVQTAVIQEVEKITGMTVTNVNVIVRELDELENEEETE